MATLICATCGTQGNPKTRTKGSILIELVLWICFIVPGILYSIWRLTTKEKVCRTCGANNLVPLTSPMGQKLRAELSSRQAPSPGEHHEAASRRCPYCRETIQADAVKCRHCHSDISLPEAVPQEVLPSPPVVLPPVEIFIDNDPGYQNWLVQHPEGFVLHCYRHRPQSSMALHQATCETISKPSSAAQPGEFTSKQYFKVCSISAEALAAWAYREGFRKNLAGCVACTVSLPDTVFP